MRARGSNITVSLSAGMLKQFERVRKAERRTRSELVREAVGTYLSLAEQVA
jgi:metal-responsive CopG/Arc/MetJ family transcriptional regulator